MHNNKIHQKLTLAILASVVSLAVNAQSETAGQSTSQAGNDVLTVKIDQLLPTDSMHISTSVSPSRWQEPDFRELSSSHDRIANFTMPTMNTSQPFKPWKGASIVINGSTSQMPGLMDAATGVVSLHQDFGRLHVSGSAVANKYWMPMQSQLHTQYGFGGTLGYELTDEVSLHAFGHYYASNPIVGPAFSPYVSTSSYGGYANIRFSERFGTDVGVRRYVNPMTGKWTTSPIVTPYIRVGSHRKWKIELPLGELLKSVVWGNRDNPMHFRPLPPPQPKRK